MTRGERGWRSRQYNRDNRVIAALGVTTGSVDPPPMHASRTKPTAAQRALRRRLLARKLKLVEMLGGKVKRHDD